MLEKRTTYMISFLSLVFMSFLTKTLATDVSGFEFGDNRGTKYVTEENGVAEVRFKEGFYPWYM